MPIQRAGTPPTSQAKVNKSLLGTLSAWTDEGGGEEEDEREKPVSKKGVMELLQGGEEQPVSKLALIKAAFDVDSDFFNMTIGLVIILNAILIGVETTYGRGMFMVFEHLFNSVFLLEMILRIAQLGPKFYFTTAWYLFDCSLVVVGSMDLWILPIFSAGKETQAVGYKLSVMRALRVVRLMRVLRVIRLFRMFQQLYLIMQAFNKAFQVVLLISLLVLIIDYVLAIVLTQAIGHESANWEGEDRKQVEMWFGTIGRSMQTLFVIMTLSDWDRIVLVLFKVWPPIIVIVFFVLYIMVTAYTMSSLITGIITDSLVTSQQEFKRKKLQTAEAKKLEIQAELRGFLTEVHEDELDECGEVAAEDLKTSIRGDTDLLNKLADIGIVTSEKGLLSLCDKMSRDGKERVNTDYFVNKLTSLQGNAQGSAVVDTKYDMVKIGYKIDGFEKKWKLFADKMFPSEDVLAPPPKEELAPVVLKASSQPTPAKRSSIKSNNKIEMPGQKAEKKVMRFSVTEGS